MTQEHWMLRRPTCARPSRVCDAQHRALAVSDLVARDNTEYIMGLVSEHSAGGSETHTGVSAVTHSHHLPCAECVRDKKGGIGHLYLSIVNCMVTPALSGVRVGASR